MYISVEKDPLIMDLSVLPRVLMCDYGMFYNDFSWMMTVSASGMCSCNFTVFRILGH